MSEDTLNLDSNKVGHIDYIKNHMMINMQSKTRL